MVAAEALWKATEDVVGRTVDAGDVAVSAGEFASSSRIGRTILLDAVFVVDIAPVAETEGFGVVV